MTIVKYNLSQEMLKKCLNFSIVDVFLEKFLIGRFSDKQIHNFGIKYYFCTSLDNYSCPPPPGKRSAGGAAPMHDLLRGNWISQTFIMNLILASLLLP